MVNMPDAKHLESAKKFWNAYLVQNIEASQTLKRMHSIIEEFRKHAARLIVSKCIDGRVHGSKGKGYPPTTVVFSRSEGNNIETDSSNFFFWRRIDEVVIDAARNTPGKPALFIALGHCGTKGHGCAAHAEDNEKALAAVKEQAERVRERYSPEKLFVIYGMTNTDDGTETLYFGNDSISSGEIIDEFGFKSASDIYQSEFLSHKLEDVQIEKYIGDMTPSQILEGPKARMFSNLQMALAMEAFLIHHISSIADERSEKNNIVNEKLFERILGSLDAVGVPTKLRGALTYQIVWNIAQGTYQRARLMTRTPE